jgi:hypothetical protein
MGPRTAAAVVGADLGGKRGLDNEITRYTVENNMDLF